MIKTKEEWERVKVVAELQSGPSLQHAVDTIEALRDVATAAQPVAARYPNNLGVRHLQRKLDALSDWIMKNGR